MPFRRAVILSAVCRRFYFLLAAFTGSFTASKAANSTLCSSLPTFLDLAHVDVLDDVARVRVDRDWAARASHDIPFMPRIAIGIAAGLFQ
jgi:hypothetical protein